MWTTVWDPATYTGNWIINTDTGDLATGDPVGTAVVLALFTDKPLPTMDSVDSQRATWHGNSFDTEEEGELGSLLWTLARSLPNDELIMKARSYIADALQPLVDQKMIRGYTMEVEIQRNGPSDVLLAIHIVTFSSTDIGFFFKYPVA